MKRLIFIIFLLSTSLCFAQTKQTKEQKKVVADSTKKVIMTDIDSMIMDIKKATKEVKKKQEKKNK